MDTKSLASVPGIYNAALRDGKPAIRLDAPGLMAWQETAW
jgi:hypothetical protein